MATNQIWVPGPWGPDIGRCVDPNEPAPETPPTRMRKTKAASKAKGATMMPSAKPLPNDSPESGSASGGTDDA